MAEKVKTKVEKTNTYESFEALYFTGKVKPALNKILAELKNQPSNLNLTLLACKCLVRTKDFDKLTLYADAAIDLDDKNAGGYYFKGLGLQHIKGKEQKALSNFDTALTLDPDNVVYLKGKAATHLLLFTDYHLHLGLAEKHRVKGEECLLKIVGLIEDKENPDFMDYLTIADVSITVNRNLDGKKYYIKAVNAFNAADEASQDMNIYKDIIKGQKACLKLIEKLVE